MLVITGALGRGLLDVGVGVVGELTRALAPAAQLAETAAWSATWRFLETPVDADSILPALAACSQVSVPAPLVLSFGVLTPGGEYVPLSFRARTLAGSANEADVNAAAIRSRYRQNDRPGPYDELDGLVWFEAVAQ